MASILKFGTCLRHAAAVLLLSIQGCNSSQSGLAAAGVESSQIASLFYVMVAGALLIWAIVIGLAFYAVHTTRKHDPKVVHRVILGGGALFPTVVLMLLLCYGLSMMPKLQSPAPNDSLCIEVSGARWWWRVRYRVPLEANKLHTPLGTNDQIAFELANEIVLPVGEPVEFKLRSEDVIHSFWIPAIGGKVDMIPVAKRV